MSQYIIADEAIQDLGDISDYFLKFSGLSMAEEILNIYLILEKHCRSKHWIDPKI
jgi:hypothetical protein